MPLVQVPSATILPYEGRLMRYLRLTSVVLAIAYTSSLPLSVLAQDSSSPSRREQTQYIVAEGVGLTADEALRDAFRSAVRQVVGAIVDAESIVKNDEIIADKVLTYSDGFIKSYEEVAGSKQVIDGIHRVKIKARVEKRSVIAKLKSEHVEMKEFDGKGLFAETVTKIEAKTDAATLLRKQFESFPQSCIKATVVGDPVLLESSSENSTIKLVVEFEPDLKACRAFADKLVHVVEKFAKSKGAFKARFRKANGPLISNHLPPTRRLVPVSRLMPNGEPYPSELTSSRVEGLLPAWLPRAKTDSVQPTVIPSTFVIVAMNRTSDADKIEYRYFTVDDSLRPELVRLASRLGDATLRLVDMDGEIVKEQSMKCESLIHAFDTGRMLNLAGLHSNNQSSKDVAGSARFFFVNNVFFQSELSDQFVFQQPAITESVEVTVGLEELKSISDAEVEITFGSN